MTFSKEDKMAWMNSEVMRELEKIALESDPFAEAEEAFKPIEFESPEEETVEEDLLTEEEDPSWEDENEEGAESIESLLESLKEFEGESPTEVLEAGLLRGLEKLANKLADQSKQKEAYRVERAVREIKNIFGEGINA